MQKMNSLKIANILYNLVLDMDYADASEFYYDEIAELAKEVELCGTNLSMVLEHIADMNEDAFDRFAPE